MDPLGVAVIVAVLLVATTFGLWRRRTDGIIHDEAGDKKRRADILAAAGLEAVELPDHSSTATAATAAKAASTAAAVALQGTHVVRPPVRPLTAVAPAADSAAVAPAAESVAPVADSAAVAPGADSAAGPAPVADSPDKSDMSSIVPDKEVVPDKEEEPGVVEDSADRSSAGERLAPGLLERLGIGPAEVTLLQFSSAFCAPCRAVRRVSIEVSELLPGVQHVEIDAESHLDEVRQLGIWRTPTLLVLDSDGRVAKRATGVPSEPQLIAAIGELLPARSDGGGLE
jgi:thiol-disulfide isomerase/thioredoxin